MTLCRK